MMSLFTPFDMMIYRSSVLVFLFIFSVFMNLQWLNSFFLKFFLYLKHLILEFFYTLKPNYFTKSFSFGIFSIFFVIIFFNFLAVWPFIFAPTSQVSVVLFLGFCLWLGMIIFSLSNNVGYFFAHSIPEGTPIYLTWFLFLIELISNSIRPITLTVRLVANILAGHLLMILLSQLVMIFPGVMPLYVGLNLVEIFVAIVQSYIFCTMICLYFSEVH